MYYTKLAHKTSQTCFFSCVITFSAPEYTFPLATNAGNVPQIINDIIHT